MSLDVEVVRVDVLHNSCEVTLAYSMHHYEVLCSCLAFLEVELLGKHGFEVGTPSLQDDAIGFNQSFFY